MKKILLSICALALITTATKAQTSYGLKAGVNFPKMKISANNVTYSSDVATSFYVTGYADVPLANSFSIQPGISLQGKGGKFAAGEINSEEVTENLMYIEVPVNLVYHISTGNSGNIFLGAGPYAGFGLHVKEDMGNLSQSGSFSDANYKVFDAGLNFLAGFRFTNGLLFNGGYNLGLTNYSKYPDETGKFKNNGFSLGVGFQF